MLPTNDPTHTIIVGQALPFSPDVRPVPVAPGGPQAPGPVSGEGGGGIGPQNGVQEVHPWFHASAMICDGCYPPVGVMAEMEVYALAEMGDAAAAERLAYGDALIDGFGAAYPVCRFLLYDGAGRLTLVTGGDR